MESSKAPFDHTPEDAALVSRGDHSKFGHWGVQPPHHTTPQPLRTDRMAVTACSPSTAPPLIDNLHSSHLHYSLNTLTGLIHALGPSKEGVFTFSALSRL